MIRATARRPLRFELDGVTVDVAVGETLERTFGESARLNVPDALEVEVCAGAGDAGLVNGLRRAEDALEAALQSAGVADLDGAEVAAAELRRLQEEHRDHERSLADALGNATFETLMEDLEATRARVDHYLETRPPDPVMATQLREAEGEAANAEALADGKRDAALEAERLEMVSRARLAKLAEAGNNARALVPVLQEEVDRLRNRLDLVRVGIPDDALAAARTDAEAQATAARSAELEARKQLDAGDGDQVRTLLGNASRVLVQMQQGLRTNQDERLELFARLKERGQDGLSERLDSAITARDTASAELATYDRKAACRKALYGALRSARDEARLAYVKPLTLQVETLGRVVFGAGFRVEINEELAIENRTLEGKTIPLRSLSAGAREQLGVIVRLACGLLVTPGDGGVPIILDDVLGFTDPARLETMGAVLAEAGRSAQVIVFTCYPDRYRQVGGATIKRIACL